MQHSIYLIFFIFCMEAFTPVKSQDIFPIANNKSGFNYEFIQPDYDLGDEISTTFFSGNHHLNFQISLNRRLSLIGGVPIVNFNLTEDIDNDSFTGSEIGNPYIGFRVQRPGQNFYIEFGTRIPLIDSEEFRFVHSFGTITDITNRVVAFLPDILPIQLMFGNTFRNRINGGFIGFHSGGTVWFDIGDGDGDGAEALLKNSIRVGLDRRQVRFSIIYDSCWLITQEGDFSDLYYNSLGMQADLKFDVVAPYVSFRKPLNENFSNFAEYFLIFGIRVSIP